MPTASRTFRIFVSSVFEDLKEERDTLQREVLPELRKPCEAHDVSKRSIRVGAHVKKPRSTYCAPRRPD